jgi:hypothetical protein
LFQSNSKVVMLKSLSEYEYIALWVIWYIVTCFAYWRLHSDC